MFEFEHYREGISESHDRLGMNIEVLAISVLCSLWMACSLSREYSKVLGTAEESYFLRELMIYFSLKCWMVNLKGAESVCGMGMHQVLRHMDFRGAFKSRGRRCVEGILAKQRQVRGN